MANLFGIQKPPLGLTQALGIQSMGQNPTDLSPIVVPSFDVTNFYLADKQSIAIATNGPLTLADQGATIVVPSTPLSEVWRVLGVSATVAPSAVGTICSCSFFLQYPPLAAANTYVALQGNAPRASVAGETRIDYAFFFPEPILLGGGVNLQGVLSAATGGVTTVSLTLRVFYQRLVP